MAEASQHEVLTALLAEAGFEAFESEGDRLVAYQAAHTYTSEQVDQVLSWLPDGPPAYETAHIPAVNWNARWEADFQPVVVDQFCQIVPSFHTPAPGIAYTILIDPKMSFGTGHHETTRLMVRQLAELEVRGKQVLDMGCGTGILGILAAKMGARSVLGIDIDAWSSENSLENISRNEVTGMEVRQGDVTAIPDLRYDLILANINRNVLLNDMTHYAKHLSEEGILVISGFYEWDREVLEEAAHQAGLRPGLCLAEGDWRSLRLDRA
ncbi:MAG: 50S ribosomal protein L11 methyltransferase [Bacteroidetes bacterium]|nr:MAG: 50S ribosomal protein L11 methyltransferase [Bacteroidota bacterium]